MSSCASCTSAPPVPLTCPATVPRCWPPLHVDKLFFPSTAALFSLHLFLFSQRRPFCFNRPHGIVPCGFRCPPPPHHPAGPEWNLERPKRPGASLFSARGGGKAAAERFPSLCAFAAPPPRLMRANLGQVLHVSGGRLVPLLVRLLPRGQAEDLGGRLFVFGRSPPKASPLGRPRLSSLSFLSAPLSLLSLPRTDQPLRAYCIRGIHVMRGNCQTPWLSCAPVDESDPKSTREKTYVFTLHFVH